MSNPENPATQQVPDVTADSTLEQRVSNVVKQFSTDENGNVTFPEELKASLDADTLYAATAEHRRRSTQAGFTKSQQSLKAVQAEKDELFRQLETHSIVSISAEDQETLDALKYEDPDAWFTMKSKLEKSARGESRANIDELTGSARKAAERDFEISRRQQVLNEFNDSAEVAITEELIANEVPPRITNKLANGEITFEDFLTEVHTYVNKGKAIKNDDTLKQPNMNNMGGGKTPKDMKPEKSLNDSYKGDIY